MYVKKKKKKKVIVVFVIWRLALAPPVCSPLDWKHRTDWPGSSHNLSVWSFGQSYRGRSPRQTAKWIHLLRKTCCQTAGLSCCLLSFIHAVCGAAAWSRGPAGQESGSWNIYPDNKQSQDGAEAQTENAEKPREKGSCSSRKFKSPKQFPFTLKHTCKHKKIDWGESATGKRTTTKQHCWDVCTLDFTPDDPLAEPD